MIWDTQHQKSAAEPLWCDACGGEGVIGGLIVGDEIIDETCRACGGTGVVLRRCRCCGATPVTPGRTICSLCIAADCLIPRGCSRPLSDEEEERAMADEQRARNDTCRWDGP